MSPFSFISPILTFVPVLSVLFHMPYLERIDNICDLLCVKKDAKIWLDCSWKTPK